MKETLILGTNEKGRKKLKQTANKTMAVFWITTGSFLALFGIAAANVDVGMGLFFLIPGALLIYFNYKRYNNAKKR